MLEILIAAVIGFMRHWLGCRDDPGPCFPVIVIVSLVASQCLWDYTWHSAVHTQGFLTSGTPAHLMLIRVPEGRGPVFPFSHFCCSHPSLLVPLPTHPTALALPIGLLCFHSGQGPQWRTPLHIICNLCQRGFWPAIVSSHPVAARSCSRKSLCK